MTKKEYKHSRWIIRYQRYRIRRFPFDMAKIQTLDIASRIYHEEDTPCMEFKDGRWIDGIVPKNKESKEDFEMQKSIDIANVWINCAINVLGKWAKFEESGVERND